MGSSGKPLAFYWQNRCLDMLIADCYLVSAVGRIKITTYYLALPGYGNAGNICIVIKPIKKTDMQTCYKALIVFGFIVVVCLKLLFLFRA